MSKQPHMLMKLGYSVFAKVRERIASDCGMRCAYCGAEVVIGCFGGDRLATIDHKVPLSKGGSWKRFNLTCACRKCNNDKGNMSAEDFMDWLRGVGRSESSLPHDALGAGVAVLVSGENPHG